MLSIETTLCCLVKSEPSFCYSVAYTYVYHAYICKTQINFGAQYGSKTLAPVSPPQILGSVFTDHAKNVLSLGFQSFLNLEAFGSNTTSVCLKPMA